METNDKKQRELKKHVAVIHSTNKLTLVQRKIANALLFNAYDKLLVKEEHEIHITTLCNIIGYDSKDYKTIKKALLNLLATVLEWNLVDGERLDSEGIWNASSIIADASINGPICTYSYSNKMKKLLYRPNIYGRLDMAVQAKFQSSYGLALYENCNRFQDIGQTPCFSMDTFRKLMGVDEHKYKIFRDFKSRVLNKAIEEVNKYSPIQISPLLKRRGRQVISIQFIITKTKLEFSAHSNKVKIQSGPSNSLTPQINMESTRIHQNLIFEYRRFQDKFLLAKFNQHPQSKQLYITQEFEKFMVKSVRGIYIDLYKRDGLAHPLVQDQFCLFLRQAYSEWLDECSVFHTWLHEKRQSADAEVPT